MADRKQDQDEVRTKAARPLRVSVTFPLGLYVALQDVARKKKVSVAWVVREASEKYIEGKWPLFAGHEGK